MSIAGFDYVFGCVLLAKHLGQPIDTIVFGIVICKLITNRAFMSKFPGCQAQRITLGTPRKVGCDQEGGWVVLSRPFSVPSQES